MSNEEQNVNNDTASSADELVELKKKSDEYLNNWKRSAADFINYKKEEMERTAMLINYTKEDMIDKILPILDNFYLAAGQMPEEVGKSVWGGGFLQIIKQVEEFLKKEGIEVIEVVGQKFNPETMEIVQEIEGKESGTVAQEVQKGYMANGKVLRPAKVKISK